MSEYVLDSCSLINLVAGLGDLSELASINSRFFLGERARQEATHFNEFCATRNGIESRDSTPLLNDMYARGWIVTCSVETQEELAHFVDLSVDLGKGESEALSLAHHRHLIMVTDDRKATRIAGRAEINVQTLTTFGLIAMLVEKNDALKARMPDIAFRMSRLAKFKCRLDGSGAL